ncbi:MAG: type IV pilus secretin PilQ [Pseudomonadota bacterium]
MNYNQMKMLGSCLAAVFLAFLILLFTGSSDSYAQQKDQKPADITGGINTKSEIQKADLTTAEITPKTATKFESVDFAKKDNGIAVSIKADGKISNFESFTIKRSNKLPARIVFDLLNITGSEKNKELSVSAETEWVSKVRYNSYADKVRVVLDTKNEYLKAFSAVPVSDGLLINIGSMELASAKTNAQPEVMVRPTSPQPIPAPDSSKGNPVAKYVKPAWVNKIDFSSEENGKSTLSIGTTKPVEYNIKKVSDRLLHLQLKNTNISASRKRPLITTRFNSAVDRIVPVQKPVMKNTSVIAIELRESVPYVVEQSDSFLMVHFEASSVPPKPEKEADLPDWKEVLTNVTVEPVETETKEPVTKQVAEAKKTLLDPGKQYTGEKIALDFFDTDIKNVFRILREVSGENFAVDKNVTGKVTLSLDKPVPWDQVLDLVLKMNQLGKIREGNIIRIATLESLKKDEDIAQALIDSKTAREKKEVDVEPLVTGYIRVNYSDPKNIKELIEKIKSERGTVSMDNRTKRIIMRDTAEKIEQAKAIVERLDTATPQVIIEARIVEVTSSLSRALGVEWGANTTPKTYGLGGTLDLDVAMNYALPSTGTIGINFARTLGSPLTLNATLHAAETEGDSKTISSPRVVTLDNTPATITQGLEYPYLERDDTGGSSVKFKAVDLKLEVTPNVTPDNRIRLKLDITKNDVASLVGGVPALATNTAKTELLINDGDTIVIGGIIKSSDTSSTNGFPGLGKIPIIGYLFGSDSKAKQRNELLIFITPRIVQLEQPSGS